ncbi:hypothetical protein HYY70_02275 [Candidatus Woesearchaeota archaeon]|nr:hypothetical protein [Candidatus Woesearchaeota archaeon]
MFVYVFVQPVNSKAPPPPPPKICTDSDGGKNYFEKGFVILGKKEAKDYDVCLDNELTEYYCEGDVGKKTSYMCPNGCRNDRCMKCSELIIDECQKYDNCELKKVRKNRKKCVEKQQPVGFRYAKWACHDGYSELQGSETSCKPSRTWKSYAETSCINKCDKDTGKCGVNSFEVDATCSLSASLPDLAVPEGFFISPTIRESNKEVLVAFKVVNIGTAVASPTLYIYSNNDDGIQNIHKSDTCGKSTVLQPGESCMSAFIFTFPTQGMKNLIVKLDPSNNLKEFDRDNNVVSTSFEVVSLVNIKPSKTDVKAGEELSVYWDNLGTAFENDYIAFAPKGAQWNDKFGFFYIKGLKSGTGALQAPKNPGTYELIYYGENGFKELVRSVPIEVQASSEPSATSSATATCKNGLPHVVISWQLINWPFDEKSKGVDITIAGGAEWSGQPDSSSVSWNEAVQGKNYEYKVEWVRERGHNRKPLVVGFTSSGSFETDSCEAEEVRLQSIKIVDSSLEVTYSKNFDVCVHLLNDKKAIMHTPNYFCTSGENIKVTQPLSGFFGISNGQKLQLCHGNKYSVCSDFVAVQEGNCTDSDEGINYYVKGSIKASNLPGVVKGDGLPDAFFDAIEVADECSGMDLGNGLLSEMTEFYCENGVAKRKIQGCGAKGCSNGACISPQNGLEVVTQKESYYAGEKIDIFVKNNGDEILYYSSKTGQETDSTCNPLITITDLKGNMVRNHGPVFDCAFIISEIPIKPGEQKYVGVWNQMDYSACDSRDWPARLDCKGTSVKTGKYRVTFDKISGKGIKATKEIEITSALKCVDSDGGKEYYTKGTLATNYPGWDLSPVPDKCAVKVAAGNYEHKDYCDGKECYVIELSCDANNNPQRDMFRCASGCKDGTCVKRKCSELIIDECQKYDNCEVIKARKNRIKCVDKPEPCKAGGCSGELCGEASYMDKMATTCEYKPKYACYQEFGKCERQNDGKCGWTQTKELEKCIKVQCSDLTPKECSKYGNCKLQKVRKNVQKCTEKE